MVHTLLIIAFVEHNHQLMVNHHKLNMRKDFVEHQTDHDIPRPATAPLHGESGAGLLCSVDFLSCEGRSFELFFFFLFDGC